MVDDCPIKIGGMILRIQDRKFTGAYSDIFLSADVTRLLKLFISGKHPRNISQWLTKPEHDEHRRATFASQSQAYEIAMQCASIRNHVPQYFGHVEVSGVWDADGKDVSDQYLLDCCYEVKYIRGEEVKLAVYRSGGTPPHLVECVKAMLAAGIRYTLDASVLIADDADRFKIIDFATREIELPVYDM